VRARRNQRKRQSRYSPQGGATQPSRTPTGSRVGTAPQLECPPRRPMAPTRRANGKAGFGNAAHAAPQGLAPYGRSSSGAIRSRKPSRIPAFWPQGQLSRRKTISNSFQVAGVDRRRRDFKKVHLTAARDATSASRLGSTPLTIEQKITHPGSMECPVLLWSASIGCSTRFAVRSAARTREEFLRSKPWVAENNP